MHTIRNNFLVEFCRIDNYNCGFFNIDFPSLVSCISFVTFDLTVCWSEDTVLVVVV